MTRADLNRALMGAYAEGDGAAIAALYAEAGRMAACEDEAAFFLTNGYIFALEAGLPRAKRLHAELVAMGREA